MERRVELKKHSLCHCKTHFYCEAAFAAVIIELRSQYLLWVEMPTIVELTIVIFYRVKVQPLLWSWVHNIYCGVDNIIFMELTLLAFPFFYFRVYFGSALLQVL